jgi:uncharacterized protein (TIGR02145 family)
MKKVLFPMVILALFSGRNTAQVVSDYDGNTYDTVMIGTQVWLKENLRVTHYNNGDLIPNITDNTVWAGTVTGARCYYNNDSASYDTVYGVLYNWYAVSDSRHLCPAGWHVSSNAEWQTAENYLGSDAVAGGKMKEEGTLHWSSPNTGATNASRFTGLPGGMRDPVNNIFTTLHENGLWWTSSTTSQYAWSTYLWYLFAGVDHNPAPKKYGLSIRCIQDINIGFESNRAGPVFNFYPNPAYDMVSVEAGSLTGNSCISIVSVTGQVILNQLLLSPVTMINLNYLRAGVYFIHYSDGDKTEVKKIIKQ